MTKAALIVVHGMGQHTEASVLDEVNSAFKDSFNLYSSLVDSNPADKFDVIPIIYNDIFDEYREALSDRSKNIATQLAAIPGAMPLPAQIVARLSAIEAKIGDDELFATHWLDVLLYRFTLLSEPIRLKVAERIGLEIASRGAALVHVLGHSLGTSVVHDTLAKAYGPIPIIGSDGQDLHLSATDHRLAGLHMVANVSRVLESDTLVSVDQSIVRPGALGCTSVFNEYRHVLDPFTMVRPFTPTDNGSWISHDTWRFAYDLFTPTSVTEVNVHSLGHYLRNPLVHLPLMRLLFKFRPKKQEREKASDKYLATTALGKADRLAASVENLSFEKKSIEELLAAAVDFKNLVKSFGETF